MSKVRGHTHAPAHTHTHTLSSLFLPSSPARSRSLSVCGERGRNHMIKLCAHWNSPPLSTPETRAAVTRFQVALRYRQPIRARRGVGFLHFLCVRCSQVWNLSSLTLLTPDSYCVCVCVCVCVFFRSTCGIFNCLSFVCLYILILFPAQFLFNVCMIFKASLVWSSFSIKLTVSQTCRIMICSLGL